MAKIKDKNGKLLEIQKNGKTVWKDDDYVQRPKISSHSRTEYKTAVNNENWKKAHSILFHILTGEKL